MVARLLASRHLRVALLLMGLTAVCARTAYADGTETLGDPGIAIAEGTRVTAAGIGLADGQPGTIEFDVEPSETIQQALLYWEGYTFNGAPGDNTAVVNGTEVTGTLIGGTTRFFPGGWSTTYRADITTLVPQATGTISLEISGLEFERENNGAGVLVILDDGGEKTNIQVRDGQDLAFVNYLSPLDTTVPQVYNFDPAGEARLATLAIFAASVHGPDLDGLRPNVVRVTIDGIVTDYANLLASSDGNEWDTLELAIPIPAGASVMSVQLLSEDVENTGALPASMIWIGSTLEISPVEEEEGETPVCVTGGGVYCAKVVDRHRCDFGRSDCDGKDHDRCSFWRCQHGGKGCDRKGHDRCVTTKCDHRRNDCDHKNHSKCNYGRCSYGSRQCDRKDHDKCGRNFEDAENSYTFGGRACLKCDSSARGAWTHHQQKGPDGSFVFQAGSWCAPRGTGINEVFGSDPGTCKPGGKAPFKQVDFNGVGVFKNIKNASNALKYVVAGKTYHYFEVHVEDLGEPGRGGKQDAPGANCPANGSAGAVADCDCPDFYRITIYKGYNPQYGTPNTTDVIYEVDGYLKGGNLVIHPAKKAN